jgi:hypothetical protein
MKKMEAQSRTGPVAGQPHASVQKTGIPVKRKSPCRRFRFLFRVVGRPARRHPFSLHFLGSRAKKKDEEKAKPSTVASSARHLSPLLFVFLFVICSEATARQQQPQKWDGNRTTPVHLIPLKDELDQPIIPTETNPLPFSSRYTCAPCHIYETIQKGLHFNASLSPNAGRAGEPWVWVDERTGTLLPLSHHKSKGSWDPAQIGLTAWDFTLLFGRHLAGGGISEPAESAVTPGSRWEVAGRIEINCLGCHNAVSRQDPSEWAKQVLRENFRWAATAASGLGEVGGMASRIRGTWDIYDGPDPDDTEWAVPPFVRYDRNLFDSRHRVLFDLSHKPADIRCLACHSVSPVGLAKYSFDEDVHTAAGLKCAGCHRNDLRHAMVRGYEGEAQDYPGLAGEDFTCAGCHLGNEKAKGEEALAGRLGAPYPKHKGFPAVHFKRLSCTVCHSGPWPGKELTRVRTSRANRLGIYGVARWSTDLPAIIEPVYIRERNGKLAPNRLLWPAFWAEQKGKEMAPLQPQVISSAAGDLLKPEQGVVNILTAFSLSLESGRIAVLIQGGQIYEVNVDGGLDASPYAGGMTSGVPVWAVKQGKDILPLIPQFDPEAEEIDPDVQTRVQEILESLAGAKGALGKPVLLYKKALFQVTETYLEKTESPVSPPASPELAWLVEGKTAPLVPDFELRTIAALAGSEQTLTEDQVKAVLEVLSKSPSQEEGQAERRCVYISGGKLFRLDRDGRLEVVDDDAAGPVTWPLGHEVRPARQSLGVNGCKDCHRFGSPFLFRKAKGIGPLKTDRVKAISANAFMRLDRPYQALFGLSFVVRPLFKWVLFFSILVVGSILVLVFLLVLGRLSGLIEKRN